MGEPGVKGQLPAAGTGMNTGLVAFLVLQSRRNSCHKPTPSHQDIPILDELLDFWHPVALQTV